MLLELPVEAVTRPRSVSRVPLLSELFATQTLTRGRRGLSGLPFVGEVAGGSGAGCVGVGSGAGAGSGAGTGVGSGLGAGSGSGVGEGAGSGVGSGAGGGGGGVSAAGVSSRKSRPGGRR